MLGRRASLGKFWLRMTFWWQPSESVCLLLVFVLALQVPAAFGLQQSAEGLSEGTFGISSHQNSDVHVQDSLRQISLAGGSLQKQNLGRRALLHAVPRALKENDTIGDFVQISPQNSTTNPGAYTVLVGNLRYSDCTLNDTLASINGTLLTDQNRTAFTDALQQNCTVLPLPPPPAPPPSSSSGFPAWAIAVIAAGAAAVLLVAAYLLWRLCLRDRRHVAKGEQVLKNPDTPYSDGLITQREPFHTGEVLQSVPAEGGNEVLRENDLQPQNFLSTAKGAYLAVRKLCQEVLARTTGTPALERLLATRGLGQEAARAALEALTSRVLLKRFENPGFQEDVFRTPLGVDQRKQHFKAVHDEAVYGRGSPSGFQDYLNTRKSDLIHTFASELGVSEGEAHRLLFGPAADSPDQSSFTKAALLVFAVNAGAFAFQRPAYLLWAEEGRSFDAYFYRSSNPRVETGRVGVSVFPAVVVTRNQVELGKVFALPD